MLSQPGIQQLASVNVMSSLAPVPRHLMLTLVPARAQTMPPVVPLRCQRGTKAFARVNAIKTRIVARQLFQILTPASAAANAMSLKPTVLLERHSTPTRALARILASPTLTSASPSLVQRQQLLTNQTRLTLLPLIGELMEESTLSGTKVHAVLAIVSLASPQLKVLTLHSTASSKNSLKSRFWTALPILVDAMVDGPIMCFSTTSVREVTRQSWIPTIHTSHLLQHASTIPNQRLASPQQATHGWTTGGRLMNSRRLSGQHHTT
jgi:hypothetical protein